MRHQTQYSIIVTFLALLVILSSCGIQTQNQTTKKIEKQPKEVYSDYLNKAKSLNEYKIIYSMDFEALKSQIGNGEIKVGLFRKKNNEKEVLETNFVGQTITGYVYKSNGEVYECVKAGQSEAGVGNDGEIKCNKRKPSDKEEISLFTGYASNLRNLDISDSVVRSIGTKYIMGRKCDEFDIRVNKVSKLVDLMGKASPLALGKYNDGVQGDLDLCLDEKTGMYLSILVNAVTKSELDGKESVSRILTISATSFEEIVNDSAFILPVKYLILSGACDKNEIVSVIEPTMDFNGVLEVSRLEYSQPYTGEKVPVKLKSEDRSMQKGRIQVVSSSTGGKLSDSFSFCLGEDCTSLNCNPEESPKCLKKSNNKDLCLADSDCVYYEPICEKFICSRIEKNDVCNLNAKCIWREPASEGVSGYCQPKTCIDFKNLNECETNELGCIWSNFTNGCTKNFCSQLKIQNECASSVLKCQWSGKRCIDYPCYNLTSEQDCSGSGSCSWSQDEYGSFFCKRD